MKAWCLLWCSSFLFVLCLQPSIDISYSLEDKLLSKFPNSSWLLLNSRHNLTRQHFILLLWLQTQNLLPLVPRNEKGALWLNDCCYSGNWRKPNLDHNTITFSLPHWLFLNEICDAKTINHIKSPQYWLIGHTIYLPKLHNSEKWHHCVVKGSLSQSCQLVYW